LYLTRQRSWSASSAASRFRATSAEAPSALKKERLLIEKRGMRSTTNGKVSWSGKVASMVSTIW